MPLTLWKQVSRLTANEYACYMVKADDTRKTLLMEAMLDCRNPDAEPQDRVYVGWHAELNFADQTLSCDEICFGTCQSLGTWHEETLDTEELTQTRTHLQELLTNLASQLAPLSVHLAAPAELVS